jgi:ATP-dependent DNA ligase
MILRAPLLSVRGLAERVRGLSDDPAWRDERPLADEHAQQDGRPSFSALQNGSAHATIVYYMFDVMILGGRNVMGETLATGRDLLSREVLPRLADPVREARFNAALSDLIAAVRAHGLEGLVAKRLDSDYEPGARSGA